MEKYEYPLCVPSSTYIFGLNFAMNHIANGPCSSHPEGTITSGVTKEFSSKYSCVVNVDMSK
jgi:hypothetical protein